MTFDLVSKQICIPVVKDTEFGTRKIWQTKRKQLQTTYTNIHIYTI